MDFARIVDWFAQESMNAAEQTNEPKRRASLGRGSQSGGQLSTWLSLQELAWQPSEEPRL